MPISESNAKSGHLFFGRGLAKLEDLRIVHIGDQLLRLFAEFINFFSLVQVLQERLLVRVALELLNQLFDCFSAIRVLLLDCRMRYAWYSTGDVAAAGFHVTHRYALVVQGFSCFLIKLILLSTLLIRLQFYTRQPWRLIDFVVQLLLRLQVSKYFVWSDPLLVRVA